MILRNTTNNLLNRYMDIRISITLETYNNSTFAGKNSFVPTVYLYIYTVGRPWHYFGRLNFNTYAINC